MLPPGRSLTAPIPTSECSGSLTPPLQPLPHAHTYTPIFPVIFQHPSATARPLHPTTQTPHPHAHTCTHLHTELPIDVLISECSLHFHTHHPLLPPTCFCTRFPPLGALPPCLRTFPSWVSPHCQGPSVLADLHWQAQAGALCPRDRVTLGCTASIIGWVPLVSKAGSLALSRNPGRAVLVSKNFYAIPEAARRVSVWPGDNYRLDVLAKYLGRDCLSQLGRIGRCKSSCDGRRSCWLLSGRRPGTWRVGQ